MDIDEVAKVANDRADRDLEEARDMVDLFYPGDAQTMSKEERIAQAERLFQAMDDLLLTPQPGPSSSISAQITAMMERLEEITKHLEPTDREELLGVSEETFTPQQ